MKKSVLVTILLTVGLVGCQEKDSLDGRHNLVCPSDVTAEAKLFNEVALLVGETANGHAAADIAKMIQDADNEFETLTIDEISASATKSDRGSIFVMDLLENLNSNADKYPAIMRQLNTTKAEIQELTDLSKLDVELYMPDSDNFDTGSIQDITVSYDPVVRDDYSDGYRYDLTTGEKVFVERVDAEYMALNPTIIVLPKDTTQYTPTVKSEDLPDGLLEQNITNSELIREQDVLYTTVKSMRVNKGALAWCGAISNKLKLAIYRASGDVEFLDNGELQASGRCHKPIFVAISKKDIKASKWIDNVHYIFDDDWDLHEYNQKIFFASEHNISNGDTDVNTTLGIGYKDGKFTADLGLTIDFNFKLTDNSKQRQHNELTRASMLATNVGVANTRDGFTIRSYGPIDMVYNFYYTRID